MGGEGSTCQMSDTCQVSLFGDGGSEAVEMEMKWNEQRLMMDVLFGLLSDIDKGVKT